jgi:hypothetical protein
MHFGFSAAIADNKQSVVSPVANAAHAGLVFVQFHRFSRAILYRRFSMQQSRRDQLRGVAAQQEGSAFYGRNLIRPE